MFRALIYLVDVDEQNGPFEYVGERGKKRLATGPAGTLLIFDANRLLHRGNPPRSRQRKVIDFCVAPRPLGFPRRVLWAGMNNWPMDPYQYPVEGMRAYPELEKKWVRVYPFAQQSPADAISFGQQSPVDPISERRSLRTMAAAFRGAVSKIGAR